MLFYRLHAAEGSYSTYMYVCRPGAESGSTYLSSNQVRVVHLGSSSGALIHVCVYMTCM